MDAAPVDTALQQLSKEQLINLLVAEKQQHQYNLEVKQQQIIFLKSQVAQLQRMLFGQKRERFEHPDQLQLPFVATEEQLQQQAVQLTERIEYVWPSPVKVDIEKSTKSLT